MPSTADLNQSEPLAGTAAESLSILSAAEILEATDERLLTQIRDACLDPGFLVVEPTDAMRNGIAATIDRMQAFFSLDDNDARKQAVRQDGSRNGWRPRYTEPAYQPGTLSSLEAFDVGVREIRSAQEDRWPDIPAFRSAVSECWEQYLELADAILERIALAAGMEQDLLASRCQTRELNSFRLLHYAADVPASEKEDVGIAAHTDFECITLLYQDSPGLELRATDGRWLDADVGVGRIIVMLDDMLERWTNGYFSATGHRVRQTDKERFSIVMFLAVDDGLTVAPLNAFTSHDNPPRYRPVTQAAHLDAEIRRAVENAKQT